MDTIVWQVSWAQKPAHSKIDLKIHHERRDLSKESLTAIEQTNGYYSTALDYRSCRLFDRSQHYNEKLGSWVALIERRVQVQLTSQILGGSNLIRIMSFLPAFQMASDIKGIHKGPVIWLFPFLVKKPAGANLNALKSLSSAMPACWEAKLTSYCQVINYLLATYETHYKIVDNDMDIMNFKHPNGQSALEYKQALWTKDLLCRPVYDDTYRFKATFSEGLRQSIRQRFRSAWAKNRSE